MYAAQVRALDQVRGECHRAAGLDGLVGDEDRRRVQEARVGVDEGLRVAASDVIDERDELAARVVPLELVDLDGLAAMGPGGVGELQRLAGGDDGGVLLGPVPVATEAGAGRGP